MLVPIFLLISNLLLVDMITKNMSIFILAVAVLGVTSQIVNPGRFVYAQGNATSTIGNATSSNTIPMFGWQTLKSKHPTLVAIPDIADIAEDKGVIGKLKDLDAKEVVKTLIALNIVRDLIQYKHAQEVQ